jgi:hypothetical protein
MYNNRIELLKHLKKLNCNLTYDGFTFKEFKKAKFSIYDLKKHGFKINIFEKWDALIDAGYTVLEITEFYSQKKRVEELKGIFGLKGYY